MKGGKQGPSRPNLPNSQVLLSLVRGIKEARQGQARPTDRQMRRRGLSEDDAALPVEMGSP